jgi:membrane protein YdbS with pleckstrin-like domain
VEEIRPEIEEVLLAYVVVSSLLAVLASAVLTFAPLPAFAASALAWLGTMAIAAYFAFEALSSIWLYLTERYAVGDGYVRMRHGWISKASKVIPTRNVACARAVIPLLLRRARVGLVVIETNDGSSRVMHNVKFPERIAFGIRAPFEPVTRPSVG